MVKLSRWLLITVVVFVVALPGLAQDNSTEALAKAAQNPVAAMISVPFQNNTTFDYGVDALEERDTQNVLNIQPVMPFRLSENWNIISRTIVPVIAQPNIPGPGTVNGIGDVTETLFFSPAKPGKVIWGVGPVVTMPTACVDPLQSGKWSAGPGVVVLTMPGHWVLGFLAQNTWSFAGSRNKPKVNAFQFQYFINYNFKKGWYLSSAPINTANWAVDSKDRWTVPVGIGGGRVFKIGKQAMNAQIGYYYNAVRPTGVVPSGRYAIRVQFQLMFPKK